VLVDHVRIRVCDLARYGIKFGDQISANRLGAKSIEVVHLPLSGFGNYLLGETSNHVGSFFAVLG